jgi:hypothetical protein
MGLIRDISWPRRLERVRLIYGPAGFREDHFYGLLRVPAWRIWPGDVCYWHKADIPIPLMNVRFRG